MKRNDVRTLLNWVPFLCILVVTGVLTFAGRLDAQSYERILTAMLGYFLGRLNNRYNNRRNQS